ncbi:hypothetical protein [Carboxylicivirga sp. N1Y90]|uniref:hypothetical protein n=1 Tax=Carboxylicivirga fragile TaxID=3417571 RepID=UPI003D3366EE|nr:hypothetical protein [Marinilabiliaceae bacterium N1Y90]
MRNIRNILIALIIVGFVSCLGIKSTKKTDYIGNFQEKQYDFFESFRHNQLADYYYDLPFELKFGGIRPFPFDSIGNKDYSWLREPENLKIAFNAFSTIGLDKFVSKAKYFEKNNAWCCDTEWENKSLNEIVAGFINSDTTSNGLDYYSKFWQRRRLENNLTITYEIFVQIDKFYNQNKQAMVYNYADSALIRLLEFDTKLIHSDSVEYKAIAIEYFSFLKSTGLDYSAYKLIFNNRRLDIEKELKDSLIMTMKYDTLSIENWENLNDNRNGWITSDYYPDPKRHYGP